MSQDISSVLVGMSVFFIVAALPLNRLALWQWWKLERQRSFKEIHLGLAKRLAPVVARWAVDQPALRVNMMVAGWRNPMEESVWLAYRLLSGLGFVLIAATGCLVVGIGSLWWFLPIAFWLGFYHPTRMLKTRLDAECRAAERGFPVLLDGLALALEGGQSFSTAFAVAADRISGRGRQAWVSVLKRVASDVRHNRGRAEALGLLRQALPITAVEQFSASVLSAEQSGLSLGQILRDQSSQARRYFQLSMERRAQEAPVKLLGPLMICIFPCTFIILFAPLVFRLLDQFS